MKYIFTSQFLKITPPATSFADAWEFLCLDLLRASSPQTQYQHLLPPDRGVDILASSLKQAFQCKADERGAFGTAPKQASIDSLRTAVAHAKNLGWAEYRFATNADYSGNAVEEIHAVAAELGIDRSKIEFHGPQYWSDLCEKHLQHVQHHLDYRLQVTEAEVIEAFRKARYFDSKVAAYQTLIANGNYQLQLRNNRTPLMLCLPFSPDLTIEHCVDVAMQLLNISLDSRAYADLGTSARPSISIVVDRVPQGFSKKIGDLSEDEISRLELWIKVIWKDETEEPRQTSTNYYEFKRMDSTIGLATSRGSSAQRGKETIKRFEHDLQIGMWGISAGNE